MKKHILYTGIAAMTLILAACTKDFTAINTNPTQPTSLDPGYLFAQSQVSNAPGYADILYQGIIVQQTMNPFLQSAAAGNVNQLNVSVTGSIWDQEYNVIKYLAEVIAITQKDSSRSNLYNMARIMRAYTFQKLTDTYGDVPYSQAGQAFLGGILNPKYDYQQDIYHDMLNELDQAVNNLDPAKRVETNDLFYQGNIAEWKHFGNSLLLRVAMRLTHADAVNAQKYAALAFQKGTFASNAENALYASSNAYTNAIGSNAFNSTEKGNNYLGQTFVDSLKLNNNPLLGVIAVKYADPTAAAGPGNAEDHTPADQIGMPVGYDNSSISTAPNFPGSLYKYSQPDRSTYGSIAAPVLFLTFSQTQLLLAEAALRGWISADPALLYVSGVQVNMQMAAIYGAASTIPQSSIDAFTTAHPYNSGDALQQISTQYWISSFLNPLEAYANWRRTGYPNLLPNNYPVQSIPIGGTIRRLAYSPNEQSVNQVNYQAAIAHQGPDALDTRIWLDK